jgi:Domain of unknown function (DUF6089)
MKKFLHSLWGTCVIMLSIFIPKQSNAQYESGPSFTEVGVTIGPSNFLGDLGGHLGKGTPFLKDNNFNLTKLMFGAHLTYFPKDWLGFRIAINIGKLEGDDAVIKGKGGLEEARKARNLNFQTKLYEGFVAAEIFPTVFFEEDASEVYHKLRPYGVIGVGAFHFNPQGLDLATGQWVYLQPLHTEGQGSYPGRKPYSLWQLNIPLGVGIKYFLSDNVSLGAEVIHRKTWCDYIDDASTTYVAASYYSSPLAARMADKSNNGAGGAPGYGQPGQKRGDPKQTDSYYSFGIKLGVRLGGGDRSLRNSTRCPVIRF